METSWKLEKLELGISIFIKVEILLELKVAIILPKIKVYFWKSLVLVFHFTHLTGNIQMDLKKLILSLEGNSI